MPLQANESLADLSVDARVHLKHHYQQEASLLAAAPGRVNLIGEHIDYCDGFVLPLAIDRHVVIAAALNNSGVARVRTTGEEEAVISLEGPQAPSDATLGQLPAGRPGGLPSPRKLARTGIQRRHRQQPAHRRGTLLLRCPRAGLCHHRGRLCRHRPRHPRESPPLPEGGARLRRHTLRHHGPVRLRFRPGRTISSSSTASRRTPNLVPFHSSDLSVLVANTMVRHKLADGEYRTRREETERALANPGQRELAGSSLSRPGVAKG